MRTRILLVVGLTLVAAGSLGAQDVVWRPAKSTPAAAPISLGQPRALDGGAATETLRPVSMETPRVVRGQIGGAPPPPPPSFPGAPGPIVGPVPGSADAYNKGMVNNDADIGGFWSNVGDRFKRCWDDVSGGVGNAFQGGGRRAMFQSDHDFDCFTSPVTNPFFFEDPRSLTEIRPLIIWQHTPSSNPVFAGGNNFEFAVRGSVAFTEHISLVISRLGFTNLNPRGNNPAFDSATGFSEFLIGPKLTFIRSDATRTVAAFGITFDIPAGSSDVYQDTGSTAIVPYFSIAQNFGQSDWGSFNFMNTTGYSFRTDSVRSESFYSSFHLDYDWKGAHRFYPLIELNWRHYTRNGSRSPINFERMDLGNFGSTAVSGRDDLNLAFGGRVVINRYVTWGIAAEFNILNNSEGRHLDAFRLTTDLIFRY